MATSNLWEITLNMEMAEQRCACVWFYRGNAITTPDSIDIAEAFGEQIVPLISDLVFNDVFFDNVSVRDILSEETAVEYPLGFSGAGGAGESLPPHDAYGFTFGVSTNVTRPGSKRIPGVSETSQVDGVITNATLITALNILADAMEGNLFDVATGLIAWAAPVIVKRILVEAGKYRLPATVGETVTNPVTTAIPNLTVSSQTSRKIHSAS